MCNLSRLLIDLKCAVRNVSFKSLLKSRIIFVVPQLQIIDRLPTFIYHDHSPFVC